MFGKFGIIIGTVFISSPQIFVPAVCGYCAALAAFKVVTILRNDYISTQIALYAVLNYSAHIYHLHDDYTTTVLRSPAKFSTDIPAAPRKNISRHI